MVDMWDLDGEAIEERVAFRAQRTGYHSGDSLRPAPGEPKPEYDPATTTLTVRRLAKVAERAAMTASRRSCWAWTGSATTR
jgi:hypothetical protein